MYTPALLATALAASQAMAFDVYATFYSSTGADNPSFDIANPGCFQPNEAIAVDFTQHDGDHTADGPYCLTAWATGYCDTANVNSTQQFEDVSIDGTMYTLTVTPGEGAGGTSEQASYMWLAGAC